ncbi:efflux transporter outer membrane subunit [Novosphingobium sp.]|uniref:efflux transporter outer membrane subunit n=1 Tax=Novosphingobium sp. TaxID=1874826 RepID=UPI0038BDD786
MKRLIIAAMLASVVLPQPGLARTKPVKVELPLPPTPAGAAPQTAVTAPIAPQSGPAQTVHVGTAAADRWWTAFASPAINDLVDQALVANADLGAAQAALRQAHDLAGAARGALFPQLDAGYQVERQRISQTLSSPLLDPNPTVFSVHTAQVSVSYALDLFGANRAHFASAAAQARVAAAQADGVRNLVSANVVLAVIQNAALQAQAEDAQTAIDSNRAVLTMLRRREALGAVGKADVAAQEAALAAAEGALPPLERARRTNLAALAVLLGLAPGAALPKLPALDEIALPTDLPLVLPSDLVAQRPDVAAAAAGMEGAGADLKAAIAARLPSITLSASTGGAARDFSDMFRDGNPFWSLLGGLTAPLFHGGTLRKQQRASQDALEAATARYRGVALQAFADVSNALTALSTDADALDAASRGDTAAQASLGFVKRQLELGSVGTLAVLNAAAAAQQARIQYVQARSARLTDTVGMFVALGGGQLGLAGKAPAAAPEKRP